MNLKNMPYHLQHCSAMYTSINFSSILPMLFLNQDKIARKVFSDAEESMLKDYFIKASKIHHGLSAKSARELAYQFAIKVNKFFHPIGKIANLQGKIGFLVFKRFPELSLRKPEAISLARATSFNKTNVFFFFNKLEECLKRAIYSPSNISNADENGCTTVQSVK